jgi:hypothetical protein
MGLKVNKNHLIDYIQSNFGYDTFEIGEIADPYIKRKLFKYCCYSVNIPNSISENFVISRDEGKRKKILKLKKND